MKLVNEEGIQASYYGKSTGGEPIYRIGNKFFVDGDSALKMIPDEKLPEYLDVLDSPETISLDEIDIEMLDQEESDFDYQY